MYWKTSPSTGSQRQPRSVVVPTDVQPRDAVPSVQVAASCQSRRVPFVRERRRASHPQFRVPRFRCNWHARRGSFCSFWTRLQIGARTRKSTIDFFISRPPGRCDKIAQVAASRAAAFAQANRSRSHRRVTRARASALETGARIRSSAVETSRRSQRPRGCQARLRNVGSRFRHGTDEGVVERRSSVHSRVVA